MATVTTAQIDGARSGPQTIEGFVGTALDGAKISPLHIKIISLIAAGYFFDVIDYIVQGSLFPDMKASGFADAPGFALIVSATTLGMFIGTTLQGEFSDRFGRRFVYQFNLLLFGTFTVLGALAPSLPLLVACRFIAGLGLGAEQPLCFAYAGEYSPKAIRGRILAIIHFVGGACVWPISTLFVLAFRDQIGWRGVWLCFGIGALIVWVLRFALPESPRYLSTHGRGKEALDVLARLGIAGPKEPLTTDAASDTKSDPFAVVFSKYPGRVIAGMICFSAFFGVAIGLGSWLPGIMTDKGFTITKSLQYTLVMNLAVPCASICMMYTLDKFGRKITSICAFIGAGLMAIIFANAGSDLELLTAGFGEHDRHDAGADEGADRGDLPPKLVERVHHADAGAGHREIHHQRVLQRFGDGEALVGHDAGQPGAEPDGDAEEGREADHAGNDAAGIFAEHDGERIALGVARRVSRQRLLGAGNAEPRQYVERFLAAAVRREVTRRFRQRKSQHPHDQRADAEAEPDAAPADLIAEREHEQRRDRPHAGAADEMNDRKNASADRLRRIFAGIGEAERLLGAEPKAGDEAAGD